MACIDVALLRIYHVFPVSGKTLYRRVTMNCCFMSDISYELPNICTKLTVLGKIANVVTHILNSLSRMRHAVSSDSPDISRFSFNFQLIYIRLDITQTRHMRKSTLSVPPQCLYLLVFILTLL